MGRFDGKICVVAGGAGDIGSEISRQLAREGAKRVIVVDIDKDKARKVAKECVQLGAEGSKGFSVDITDEEKVKRLFIFIKGFGKLGVLVNCVAKFQFGKVTEVTKEQWRKVLDVNVMGYSLMIKHAMPLLEEAKGCIVNVGSVSSYIAQPAFVPYNTSKGAIAQMTRCIALDHGPAGVRCNMVAPGTIDTSATTAHADKMEMKKEDLVAEVVADLPIKRIGATADVAKAVAFLASDEASWITGVTLPVDGGLTMR